jgi:hypothetical protein
MGAAADLYDHGGDDFRLANGGVEERLAKRDDFDECGHGGTDQRDCAVVPREPLKEV